MSATSPVSAVPDIIDALVAGAAAALPRVHVSDGAAVAGDSGDYLMIGVDDEDLLNVANTAQSQQVAGPASLQHPRDETGTITVLALSHNGDGPDGNGAKTARDAVYTIAGALSTMCRADPTLGLRTKGYRNIDVHFGAGLDLRTSQSDAGSEAALIFTLGFDARITA